MVIPLFPYYFAHKKWQDSSFFKYFVGPTALTVWMVAASFYNLRMFYRVPHRYSSSLQPCMVFIFKHLTCYL